MSGYLTGLLAILALNIILAYAVFLPTLVGIINLGTAGFAAVGAYSAAFLNGHYGMPLPWAVVSGAAFAGFLGFLIAFPILRTQGVYIVLATFAFGELATGIILNLDVVGGASGYPVVTFTPASTLVLVAAVVGLGIAYLYSTSFGLAMRAVHDDAAVAELFGVNVRFTKVAGFVLGAFVAGIGGALYAFHYSYIEVQNFNQAYSTYVLLYVLLGGIQTIWGPLVGALVFGLLPEAFRVSAEWRYVIFGVVIVLLMAFRPQGMITRNLFAARRRKPYASGAR